MKSLLTAATLLTALAFAAPSEAQQFTLRGGANIRPLIGYSTAGEGTAVHAGDLSWIGIDIVPGLQLAKVLAVEVGLTPMIPLAGDPGFVFLVSPGVRLDLQIVYVRGAIPIAIQSDTSVFFEAAAGLSFLGSGYFGALLDYDTNGTFMLGAEVGWKFGL